MTAAGADTGITRIDLSRWSIAALIALAAHVGAIASYLLLHQPNSSSGTPVVMIEMAPVPTSAQVEPLDIPEEKPMEEAEVEPEPEVKPPDEPPPPETQPQKAEVVIPVEKPPPPKPVVKPKKPPAPKTVARSGTPKQADFASGPQLGVPSAQARNIEADWITRLRAQLLRHHRYPANARSVGVVRVGFSVDRNGRVLSSRILQSSGYPELDQAALQLLQRAQPLPAFPAAMTQAHKDLNIPVKFDR